MNLIPKSTPILLFALVMGIATSLAQDKQLYLADPTIFEDKGTFYLYGTGSKDGFKVYTSTDTKNWEDKGFALKKGDAFGNEGFWAPQVFRYKQKFYMAYVADEQIAIAQSESPLGPFTQKRKQALAAPVKIIDPFLFFEGGKIYLYHVRLQEGNRIFVAQMTEDLSEIKENTVTECIQATEPWENTQQSAWPVTEGPTVLKHQNLYYLFYSANDFRNIDYAVGYATSTSPNGPWTKNGQNPLLSRKQTGWNGSGHGDFFTDRKGRLTYVFHTHYDNDTKEGKRKTALVQMRWNKSKMQLIDHTARFLTQQ